MSNIKWFEPLDEPDVPFDEIKDAVDAGDSGRRVRADPSTARRTPGERGRAARPDHRRGQGQTTGLRRFGFTCSGSLRLSRRGAVLVRLGARRGRRLAADLREPRRDGRRLGAVRGVGRLQHGDIDTALVYGFGKPSQGGRSTGDRADASSSTPTTWLRSASTRSRWPRCRPGAYLEPGTSRTRSCRRRRAARPGAQPLRARPARPRRGRLRGRAAAAVRHRARSPTAPPRSCWRPATWPGSCANGPPGSRGIDHRIEAHSLGIRDLARSASAADAGRAAGGGTGARRGGGAARAVQPRGADPARGARSSATDGASTRPAGRWRPTRSWRPA